MEKERTAPSGKTNVSTQPFSTGDARGRRFSLSGLYLVSSFRSCQITTVAAARDVRSSVHPPAAKSATVQPRAIARRFLTRGVFASLRRQAQYNSGGGSSSVVARASSCANDKLAATDPLFLSLRCPTTFLGSPRFYIFPSSGS